jgi:hypothetical protein
MIDDTKKVLLIFISRRKSPSFRPSPHVMAVVPSSLLIVEDASVYA